MPELAPVTTATRLNQRSMICRMKDALNNDAMSELIEKPQMCSWSYVTCDSKKIVGKAPTGLFKVSFYLIKVIFALGMRNSTPLNACGAPLLLFRPALMTNKYFKLIMAFVLLGILLLQLFPGPRERRIIKYLILLPLKISIPLIEYPTV